MKSPAYTHGAYSALTKLGLFPAALGGAAVGGLAGYALAPEGRGGHGAMYGAGFGGLGAGLGSAAAPLWHNAEKAGILSRAGVSAASTGLGTLAGIGAAAAHAEKPYAPTSEDPYRYGVR